MTFVIFILALVPTHTNPQQHHIHPLSYLIWLIFYGFQCILSIIWYFVICRLRTGWSTGKPTAAALDPSERDAILDVIRRNEQLEVAERQRVGKLVERVEKIKERAAECGPRNCRCVLTAHIVPWCLYVVYFCTFQVMRSRLWLIGTVENNLWWLPEASLFKVLHRIAS